MLLKLAWRNIFRNKKRSIISIASVVFAVFFAVFMRSIQYGTYDNMLKNIVGNYLGYVQVQHKDFFEEKSIDNSFELTILDSLTNNPHVSYILPRIEGFVLASHQENSKPALVLGIDPKEEANNISLSDRLVDGTYLSETNRGVLIGKDLLDIMEAKIGDTLTLLGQGYQGSIAADNVVIRGSVDLRTPELNKRTLVINFSSAQELFGLEGMATTAVIGVEKGKWELAEQELNASIDTSQYAAVNWRKMVPEIDQIIKVDKLGGTFTILILYMIIAFGLFGTVLMLTEERMFEYGILVSLGMQKKTLIKTTLIETGLMAFCGIVGGLLLALPVVLYFHFNPINLSGQMQEVVEKFGFEPLIPASLDISIAITHGIIIFVITMLVSLYAVYRIRKLHPIKAMRR